MQKLIEKIGLKDSQRICILNPDSNILSEIKMSCSEILIDEHIDPKFLYNFFLIYASTVEQINELSNQAVHNLYEDGIIWFIYPKADNGEVITQNSGWDILKNLGFKPVKHIVVDDSHHGIRFRNSKFVKTRKRRDKN